MLRRARCCPSSPFAVLGTTSASSPKLPESSDSVKSLQPKYIPLLPCANLRRKQEGF